MPTQTTLNLSNSQRVQYQEEYVRGSEEMRLYDQLAKPVGKNMAELIRGSSVQVEYLSDMEPATTAISQTADIEAVVLRDAVASVTPTSRGAALRSSELTHIQSFTNYANEWHYKLGKNQMVSVDLVAMEAALQGTWVSRATTRALLDKDTATHRCTPAVFAKIDSLLQTMKVPYYVSPNTGRKVWVAIMPPQAYYDFRTGTPLLEIGQYQNKESLLNWEMGEYGPFKIISSAWAKIFGSAGADNATNVATTLNGAVNALATTIVTTDDVSANIAVGEWWTLGIEETANTFYSTNEPIKVLSAVTNTLTIQGTADNGGLKYDHADLTPLRNADHVYPVCFGAPAQSLVKVYDPGTGEYGKVIGPTVDGRLEQFIELAWKWYGGYSRMTENSLLRGEYSSSLDV